MLKPNAIFPAALLLAALVYWLGLHGPLVFDDAENLAPLIRWMQGQLSWQRVVLDNASGNFGRPISMASFVFNVWVLGPEIWGLKLGNLLIHLLNGVLVYALFASLLRQSALVRKPIAIMRWLPALGASVWLVHPLLVSTVLYVVQRMAMLSASFMLLAMLAYLHGRVGLIERRNTRAILLLLAVPLCTILAALSKENGVLAPALCALIELFAFAPRLGERRSWASRIFIVIVLVIPALIGIALTVTQNPAIMDGYGNRPFTLVERLLTQSRVLWSYIGSLLLPFGPRLGLYHDDFPVSHSLFDPATTALALFAWAVVLAWAWRKRRDVPGFALGVGIFLIGQSLESSVFPLLMYFEHRNYLPAVGAIWALLAVGAWAGARLHAHLNHGTRLFAFSALALVLVLAAATAARSSVWQTQRGLLVQGLAYHPQSRWVRMELAQQAMREMPPDVAAARKHADALQKSDEPSTRRLAGVLRLLIDCSSNHPALPSSIALAFDGQAKAIEVDLLMPIEALADGIKARPCANLDVHQMANLLVGMLDRATVPRADFNVRRLRFKAAQLYLAAGDTDHALVQARLGDNGTREDAPMGVFVAGLEISRGNLVAARILLQRLDAQVPMDDRTGREFLEGLHRQLDDATPLSKPNQKP